MNTPSFIIIEQYLDNQLSDKEKSAFEQACQVDFVLRSALSIELKLRYYNTRKLDYELQRRFRRLRNDALALPSISQSIKLDQKL